MSNYRETISAPFVLVPQHFGSIVFDRAAVKYYPFDAETTTLLERAEHMPFEMLIAEISDPDEREQARNFFFHFYDIGFFTVDHYFVGKRLDVQPANNHLTGPLHVHLEVIAACNLKCSHCFAGDLPRRDTPLSLQEIEALFEDMAKMGSYRISLTGGEPLLRKDIFEIIDLAIDYGLHPSLTTNGLLINEDIAREFGKRNHRMWLNVSLEGAISETNDTIRGTGVSDEVIQRASMLGTHASFALAFTLMRHNVHEVADYIQLAQTLGASTVIFRPLYPVGTAINFLDELMPTFEQYTEAMNLLTEINVSSDMGMNVFSPSQQCETQAVIHDPHSCGAGHRICSISVSGDVNPCSFLGSGFVADNIRHRSLSEIWHSSGKFNEIRNHPGGTDETFNGGCCARSLVMSGSANAPDPWVDEQDAMMKATLQSNVTFYNPLDIVRVAGQDE